MQPGQVFQFDLVGMPQLREAFHHGVEHQRDAHVVAGEVVTTRPPLQ